MARISEERMASKYKVVGSVDKGFAVVERNGAIVYDLLSSKQEARGICKLLNRGVGPDWESVERELAKERP